MESEFNTSRVREHIKEFLNKYIYSIIGAICLGSITSIGKIALIELTPQTTLLLRFAISIAIIIFAISLFKNIKSLIPKDWKVMIGIGVFYTIETIGFWIALDNIEIIQLLALFWSFPLMILIIDIILGKIDNKIKSVSLVILGIIGVFLAGGF